VAGRLVISWALAQEATRQWLRLLCGRRDVVSSWALAQGSTRRQEPVRDTRVVEDSRRPGPRRSRCRTPFPNRAPTAVLPSSG